LPTWMGLWDFLRNFRISYLGQSPSKFQHVVCPTDGSCWKVFVGIGWRTSAWSILSTCWSVSLFRPPSWLHCMFWLLRPDRSSPCLCMTGIRVNIAITICFT
jgi:hypothetical protein